MRRLTTYCCGRSGIDYGDWAFVEMGQDYAKNGLTAIERALALKKRVLVVGIYVSSSAFGIQKQAMSHMARSFMARFGRDFSWPAGKEVVFSKEGTISHPHAVQWVLDAARDALDIKPTRATHGTTGNGTPHGG